MLAASVKSRPAPHARARAHTHVTHGTHAHHARGRFTRPWFLAGPAGLASPGLPAPLARCLPAPLWNTLAEPRGSGPRGEPRNCRDSSTESSEPPGWTPGAPPRAGHWGPHTPFWPSLTRLLLPEVGSCCSPTVCRSVSGWASEALWIRTAGPTGAPGRACVNGLPAEREKQSCDRVGSNQYMSRAITSRLTSSLRELRGRQESM